MCTNTICHYFVSPFASTAAAHITSWSQPGVRPGVAVAGDVLVISSYLVQDYRLPELRYTINPTSTSRSPLKDVRATVISRSFNITYSDVSTKHAAC